MAKLAQKSGFLICGITSAFVSTTVITGGCISKAQAAKVNLVTNGDFTADSLLNPNDSTRNNPFITGWTNSESGNAYYTNYLDNYTVDNAENNSLSVRFGASSDFTFLSQILKTKKNKEYQLTYYLANVDEDNTNTFRTYVGGQLLDEKINVPFQGFTEYTYNFVATSKQTELKFASKQGSAWYNLDNVSVFRVKDKNQKFALASVEPVPEPSIAGGIAVSGLIAIWLKKKRLSISIKPNRY
ncbi:DUF642 domain-containing protein [Nostocaceae cyanobacterium CENA369]|uniref:DUF642 domain-containing protein n=1 Tax=Dendronalium phyllosphericum CENA369 TaxID=1725256 RepID=A0A8J7LIY8_9NOST|nr:DUF642 domain-containing protein [Dendronalium phyllosphericum]MBH8577303.1 DUF642 domain-containing protein [Dendronalium phyllosphericum CENA369]